MQLNGKKAMVIGGSRGIGAAIVRRLTEEGAQVSFTYRGSAEASAELARQTGAHAVLADSADREALIAAVATEGPLDILVASAGIVVAGDPLQIDPEDVERLVRVNLIAPYFASVEAARTMPDGGRIIIIGSCVADHAFMAGTTPYTMTKAGIQGIVRGLARDLGKRRITVNAVQPGPVATDMNPRGGPGESVLLPLMSIRRFIEPVEIAEFVTYLAGPHAEMITGAIHTIDGGQNA